MEKINLSYIITTRNKLIYLQEAMKRLIANVQPDEEIIVIDGASTDGSAEYLNDLYKNGFIHQFISEPDICQAHGTNKGMLMAKGELIKIITDDDVFFYPGIQKCKEFMLSHPLIDVLNGNAAVQFKHKSPIRIMSERQDKFLLWFQSNGEPFWFSDHGLIFRRDKLPVLGLWHTGVICIDVDFTLRITSLRQLNLAWFTGTLALAMICEDSNFTRFSKTVSEDEARISRFYIKGYSTSKLNKTKTYLYAFGKKTKSIIFPQKVSTVNNEYFESSIIERFKECDSWLLDNSEVGEQKYYYKDNIENRRLLQG